METKFTKGEWIADLRLGCCAVYPKNRKYDTNGCHPNDDRNIFYSSKGRCKIDNVWTMDEEQKANAKLIASAPDMLESLIKMCEYHEKNASLDKVDNGYYQAKQAIKKATE